MTDAGYLVYTVSFTKDLSEERLYMTEGCRKKGEMAGLGSANGQVPNCMI
jgi:hypothetical protein